MLHGFCWGKRANAFGLYDMIGNYAEVCEDTYQYNYDGAPTDGSAWIVEPAEGFNAIHVVRGGFESDYYNGGSVGVFKVWLRGQGNALTGFRCVRDIQEEDGTQRNLRKTTHKKNKKRTGRRKTMKKLYGLMIVCCMAVVVGMRWEPSALAASNNISCFTSNACQCDANQGDPIGDLTVGQGKTLVLDCANSVRIHNLNLSGGEILFYPWTQPTVQVLSKVTISNGGNLTLRKNSP